MKYILLPAILILSVVFNTFGQGGYYTPQTFPTPYGNITTYQFNRIPIYYSGKRSGSGSAGPESVKNEYNIVLKNDSVINVFARIDIKDSIQSITFKKKKQKFTIKPSDTKEIICLAFSKPRRGVPTDSCWLFKSVSGRITAYSYLPDPGTIYIVAVKKDNGQIIGLTKEVLLVMVSDNPKAIKKAENDQFVDAIKIYNKSKH